MKFRDFLYESSNLLKLKDLTNLVKGKHWDDYYIAGEVADYIQYNYIKNNFKKGIMNESITPDRGGNHGKNGYFKFVTPSNTYILEINDFSDLKDVVKEVNGFVKTNKRKIERDLKNAEINVSPKVLSKITGAPESAMNQEFFAGEYSFEIHMEKTLNDLNLPKPDLDLEKARIIKEINNKYPKYKSYFGLGNIISIAK
jgi:hypothetical protein